MPYSPFPLVPVLNCPACRQNQRRRLFRIPGSWVQECENCGLRYLHPCLDPVGMKKIYESDQTLSAFHDFHEGYYDYGDLKTPSATLRDFKRGLSLLENHFPLKGRILDIGFGNGLFLAAAQERGWEVRGIDSSKTNLEKAREKFGLELTQSGLENFETPERFEAISFWDVIEHLPNPHSVLEKSSKLLKPGGLILIAVPNDHSFLAILSAMLYRMNLRKPLRKIYFLEHVAYYSLKTLTPLLAENGFARREFFHTSTDLAKFNLSWRARLAAALVLLAGKIFHLENRLVAVFQKKVDF